LTALSEAGIVPTTLTSTSVLIELPIITLLLSVALDLLHETPTPGAIVYASVIISVVIASLWSAIAMMIGNTKGRPGTGTTLAWLFGGMGVLLTLAIQGDRKECTACYSLIRGAATVCAFCGEPQLDLIR
jgi:hypothetical protein